MQRLSKRSNTLRRSSKADMPNSWPSAICTSRFTGLEPYPDVPTTASPAARVISYQDQGLISTGNSYRSAALRLAANALHRSDSALRCVPAPQESPFAKPHPRPSFGDCYASQSWQPAGTSTPCWRYGQEYVDVFGANILRKSVSAACALNRNA